MASFDMMVTSRHELCETIEKKLGPRGPSHRWTGGLVPQREEDILDIYLSINPSNFIRASGMAIIEFGRAGGSKPLVPLVSFQDFVHASEKLPMTNRIIMLRNVLLKNRCAYIVASIESYPRQS